MNGIRKIIQEQEIIKLEKTVPYNTQKECIHNFAGDALK
jgi:hypothetical protein